ncbi:MAG: AsmA family protein [Alphaproteobacteria bacterium]
MKRILIAIAVLLVLVTGLVLILPGFVDWNEYRNEIAAQIEDATGRRVSIEGDVSFAVLPSPALSIAKMRIANLPGASSVDVATLESLDVEVALFPLLTGTVQVERIVLVDPVIDLEVLPDGRQNWVFEGGEPGSVDTETSSSGFDISVDSFVVTNGTVLYRTGSGPPRRIDGLDLDISARSLSGPFEADGTIGINDVPFAIDLAVGRLNADTTPVRLTARAAPGNFSASFSGQAVLNADVPSIKGEIDVAADNLAIMLATTRVTAGGNGLLASPMVLETQASANADRIVLDSLTVSLAELSGKGGASVDFEDDPDIKLLLNLTSVDLDALLARQGNVVGEASGPTADTGAEKSGLIPEGIMGTAEITVGSLAYRGGIIRQARITASLEGGVMDIGSFSALLPGGSDFAFNGKLGSGESGPQLTGRARLASSSARGLLAWLGVDAAAVPGDRLSQLTLDANVAASDSLLRLFDIDLMLDTTQVTGAFGYAIQDRPSFSADLSADRINLDAYLPPVAEDDTAPLDLSALQNFDTRLRFAANNLTYNRTAMEGVSADLDLVDGELTINQLAVANAAGVEVALTGSGRDFAEQPRWEVSLSGKGDQAGSLLRVLDIDPPSEAIDVAAVDLSATFRGTSAAGEGSVEGTLGDTAVTFSGEASGLDGDSPNFNVRVDASSASWANLAEQLDLADFKPMEGADGPAGLRGTVVGAKGEFDTNLEATIAGSALSVNGKLTGADEDLAVDLLLRAKGESLPALLNAIGIRYEAPSADVPFEITAPLKGAQKAFQIAPFAAELAGTELSGTIGIDVSDERPVLDAELSTGRFDADLFLPERDAGPRLVREQAGERWSKDPVGYSFLKTFNGTLVLKADEFRFRRYLFDDPSLDMALTEGVLELKSLSGFLFGGEVALSGVLDVSATPVFTVDVDLNEGSVAQALQTSADLQSATGTFDMQGRFAGQGESEFAIVSGLRGRGNIEARDGVMRGFDLVRLSEKMLTLTEYRDFIGLADAAFDGGETPYDRITAPLIVTDGKISIADGRAQLAAAAGTFTADVNLPAWSMDSQMQFRLTDPAHAETPPAGLRLYGDIDNLRQERRIKALGSYIGSRLASRVLQDVLGQGEQGNNGLQQLLGGAGDGQGEERDQAPQANPMEQLFRGIMDQVRQGRE